MPETGKKATKEKMNSVGRYDNRGAQQTAAILRVPVAVIMMSEVKFRFVVRMSEQN
jgi:hypothetical protein